MGERERAERRDWKYATKTESAIKQALLRLLAEKPLPSVAVAELAREAGVSRSTFYEHYGNPADVYDDLIADFGSQMSPLVEQVACSDSPKPAGRPFCALVRDGGRYGALVDDDRFLPSFLGQYGSLRDHDLHGVLTHAGYTDEQARAVCAFQLSGCFSAARSSRVGTEDWEGIRAVIDRFILGGIAACLAAKRG